MESERLPGKVMAELAPGIPVMAQLIDRWKTSDRAPVIVVTTTTRPADDVIEAMCRAKDVACSRSDPVNVVAQMDAAVRRFAPGARFVARALADNPLVDVPLADWRLDVLEETKADGVWYGPDHHRITYAGTTDVWSRACWDVVVAESQDEQLEHPGKFYWDNLARFSVVQIPLPRREYLGHIRTELDTLRDLEMFQAVWAAWEVHTGYRSTEPPPTLWALKWLANNPMVAMINSEEKVKTQSRPLYGTNMRPFMCKRCQQGIGAVSHGKLTIFCPGCGARRLWIPEREASRKFGWVP
jgi:spore coat polysaccharide biosynthesis protein SpsF (cytidylyltransferase family)